ncbi:MAG: hypothetical protein JWQ89_780, partial [Devosia sp.]|nr:hypothetical protein [Devosia sp.]
RRTAAPARSASPSSSRPPATHYRTESRPRPPINRRLNQRYRRRADTNSGAQLAVQIPVADLRHPRSRTLTPLSPAHAYSRHSIQPNRTRSFPSDWGPGLSVRSSPVSVRRRNRLVASDMRIRSPGSSQRHSAGDDSCGRRRCRRRSDSRCHGIARPDRGPCQSHVSTPWPPAVKDASRNIKFVAAVTDVTATKRQRMRFERASGAFGTTPR